MVAEPRRPATAAGRSGVSGTTRRPATVRLGSSAADTSAERIAAQRTPTTTGRGQGLAGTRRPLLPAIAVGEDEHESRPVVGRRQVPVEERLEVAVRGRDPGRLLDLEGQLATGGPIDPRSDDDDVARVGEGRGHRLGRGRIRGAGGHEATDRVRVRGLSPESRPDRGRCEERRDVADRVAPALVELLGRDDDVCDGRAGRPVRHRHDRRPRPGRARTPRAPGSWQRFRPRARCR